MKYLVILVCCLNSFASYSQEEFDGHKWEAPYHLPAPKDWGIERFKIPISFAPEIIYKGIEDIRFTPGWAKRSSTEYWSYAFLWYLDGKVQMDEKIIAKNLEAYYTGLFNVNTDSAKRAAAEFIPVSATFKKITTGKNDMATYSGSVEMMDYLQMKPIILNCIVHLSRCTEDNKTIIFYELSPRPFTDTVWSSLGAIWSGFKCAN